MRKIFILIFIISTLFFVTCKENNDTKIEDKNISDTPKNRNEDSLIRQKNNLNIDTIMNTEFSEFWYKFKKYVLDDDVDSVILMTNFPFTDFRYIGWNPKDEMTFNSKKEFKKAYKKIFIDDVKKYFLSNTPTNYATDVDDYVLKDDELFTDGEKKYGAEYFLGSDIPLLFGKIDNNYKLIGIKYFP